MFLLATTGTIIVISTTAISMRMVSLFVQGDPDSPARLLRLYQSLALGQDIILAINNLVTDLLFLYRCYVIWGARRTVLLLPVMMILATMTVGCITGLGYYGVVKLPFFVDPRVPFIMGASTNVVLMGLTAGRIWYIRREAGAITGQHSLRQRYGTAVAIILESGFLYCICVIFYEISMSMKDSSVYGTISIGVAWGLVQVGVNIVPTLILVRVGLGRSTENGLHVRPSFDSSTTESTRPFKEGEAFAGQMKFREISGDC
ncbi:hypothetical protein DFH08DRAFT_871278 [Mycena albidolilacea]|uniref:Uncharacterized protein n=1 Tax=Mycena albidolilacea TaxID=1033008 RepID=A0AAD7EPY5_9AGAR|nr:hypothetical protein DFH08DRAFT_871278 [Mycena albidolilacea]